MPKLQVVKCKCSSLKVIVIGFCHIGAEEIIVRESFPKQNEGIVRVCEVSYSGHFMAIGLTALHWVVVKLLLLFSGPPVSMANNTLTDLLLFSALCCTSCYTGEFLLYIYIKNSDMGLDAGDSRWHGLFLWRKRTDDPPQSVRKWLLQSWVSVCFSRRLFLKAHTHTMEILLIKCW